MAGARAVQESILKEFPDTDVSVSMVWIEMLPTDNLAAAESMAASIRDSRVTHFFDPRGARLAGHALADGIIRPGAGPAWDVYLFYGREAEWHDAPPKPKDWWHQLGDGLRADPSRFAGGILGEKLLDGMHKLTGTPCTHGPEAK
jgi:hypothetical protein